MTLVEVFTAIGNAIREKEGTTDVIPVADMAARIVALNKSFPYKITVIHTGDVESGWKEQFYYDTENLKAIVVFPWAGTGVYSPSSYSLDNCIAEYGGVFYERGYHLSDFTGDATLTVMWTKNTGGYD